MDLPDPLETINDAAESLTKLVRGLCPEEMHRIDLVGRGGLEPRAESPPGLASASFGVSSSPGFPFFNG